MKNNLGDWTKEELCNYLSYEAMQRMGAGHRMADIMGYAVMLTLNWKYEQDKAKTKQ